MRTRICLSLATHGVEPLLEACRRATADVIEVRLDSLRHDDLPDAGCLRELVAAAGRPLIVTCRPEREGGGWSGSEPARLALLDRALTAGAWRVDLEDASDDRDAFLRAHRERVVLSWHDLRGAGDDLEDRAERMRGARPAIVKIVVVADRLADAAPVLRVGRRLRAAGQPAACFAMGTEAAASRMLDASAGGALLYASPPSGVPTAAGQWSAAWLLADLAPATWGEHGERFGLIGDPIEHSLSPAVFNAAFRVAGNGGAYVPLPASDLDEVLALAGEAGIAGLSVTMPFKQQVLSRCRPDEIASRIGAANTLARDGTGGWIGTNTDGPAVVDALRGEIEPGGADILVLGAGGAARAAVVCLAQAGARVWVTNRTESRGRALAEQFGVGWISADEIPARRFAAVLNATSAGMDGTARTALSTDGLRGDEVVMEMVYRPHETELLRRAKGRGCRVVPGIEMFLRQAARQFRVWIGEPAPFEVMRAAAYTRLGLDPGVMR